MEDTLRSNLDDHRLEVSLDLGFTCAKTPCFTGMTKNMQALKFKKFKDIAVTEQYALVRVCIL